MSDEAKQEKKKQIGMLEDSNGDKSSKRIMGVILISAGGLLLIAVGVVSIFLLPKDQSTSITAGHTLVMTGAVLLLSKGIWYYTFIL